MRAFRPSPEFIAFFNTIIAAAEAPVTAGSYAPAIPTFANPEEQAFAQTKLAELIDQIDRMRKSLIPPAPSSTDPYVDPYATSAP